MGTHEADATGTLGVLVAAQDAGVQRVVYDDSSAADGASTTLPSHEGLVPMRLGDIKHSQADIGAARAVLGYDPPVPLEEGLRRTVEWIGASDGPPSD